MLKKRILSAVLLMLAVILLMSGVPLTANAEKTAPPVYDLADPAAPTAQKVIKASDFLTLLNGKEISEAEASYVDSALDEVFAYSDSIPLSKVTVHYDGERVYVSAASYEYTSASGITVRWIPMRVNLGNSILSLSRSEESGEYECETDFAAPDDSDDPVYATVEYSFEFTVSSKDADSYLNYAYTRAVEIDGENKDYELRLAAYNDYESYLAAMKVYEVNDAAYRKYLSDKQAYETLLKKYEKYLTDRAAYEAQLVKYLAYKESLDSYPQRLAEYNAYLKAKADYEKQKADYAAYLALVEKATAKLSAIDNAFIRNSKSQVLYNTLWGPTVSEVISRQDELISIGKVDGAVITATGDATERLKELLRGYSNLSKIPDKYNYYVANYEAIKENFIILYRNLRQLYENEAVYAGIVMKERLERYVEFLSHLYVVQSCLDDGYNIDESWIIKREYDDSNLAYNYYSYKDVLEACQIPTDTNNASPADLPKWPDEVKEPTAEDEPAVVEKPTLLPEVKEPMEPDEVEKPTEPTEVDEPVRPAEVPKADKPVKKTYTAAENKILEAYVGGELSERQISGDIKLTFTASCKKLVPIDDRYLVTFYDDDGVTILHQYFAGYTDVAEYTGEIPTKPETDKYTYSFSGWKTADGKDAVFEEITDYETVFYASYNSSIKSYKVTWIVEGNKTEEYYEYGQLPSYNGVTDKERDERYRYTFTGWDKPIEKVVGEAVYTAQYEKTARKYTVVFEVDGVQYSDQYEYGQIPEFKFSTDKPESDTYIYTFTGWDKEIEPVKGYAIYTAVYNSFSIAEDGEENALSVETADDDRYLVTVPRDTARIDRLLALGKDKNRDTVLSFLSGKVTLSITTKAAASFLENGGVYVNLETSPEAEGVYSFSILSVSGEAVTLDTPVSVMISDENINEYTRVYTRDQEGNETRLVFSYNDRAVIVKISSGAELVTRHEYSVTVNEFNHGVISSNVREAKRGDTVAFEVLVDTDYYIIEEIIVLGSISGERYDLDSNNSLVMPDEPITVSVVSKERLYTVIFMSDGKVISSKQYRWGELIERPEDPTKAETEDKIYRFLEWDPLYKDGTTVSGDVTYTAVFKEQLKEDQKGFVPEEDNRFVEFVLLLICCFLGFVILLLILIIVLIKRKKKRKKNAKKKAESDKPEVKEDSAE